MSFSGKGVGRSALSGSIHVRLIEPIRKAWPSLIVGLLFVLHLFLHARLFTAPRLWAEEMSVYLSHALVLSTWDQLLFIYERTGYIYLAANLTAILASAVPLEYAAWVTTYLSALVVALCLWKLVELNRVRVLGPASLLVLAGGLLFGGFASYEVWYNSINTQVFLGVLTLLILLQQAHCSDRRHRAGILDYPLLLLCGLSGPYAALLWPLFMVAWLVFRSSPLLRSGLVLLACFVVQATIAMATSAAGTIAPGKVAAGKLPNLGAALEAVSAAVFPFGGIALPLAMLAAAAVLAGCAYQLRCSPRDTQGWLTLLTMAAVLSWILLITIASHVDVGGRYLFAPGFALLLAMVLAARFIAPWQMRALLMAGLGVSALMGLARYPGETLRNCTTCPSWGDGVRQVQVLFGPESYSPALSLDWVCRDPQSGANSICRKQTVASHTQLCAILAEPAPQNTLHAILRTHSLPVRLDPDRRVSVVAWPHERWRGWVPLAKVIGCE